MDAFSKFFQKKTFSLGNSFKGCPNDSKSRSEVTFGKDSVRLFVYRDHDLKGRKLLFDSKAKSRLGDSQKTCCVRRKGKDGSSGSDSNTGQPPTDTKGSGKQALVKDSSESSMVAEMMFGSVAMAYKGPTLKVHTIRTPSQVMITKIFVPVQQPGKEAAGNDGEFDSCSYQSGSSVMTAEGSTSLGSIVASGPCSAPAVVAHSIPVAVPSPPPRSLDHLLTADTGDSGIVDSGPSSHSSHNTPFPSPSSSSTSSSSYIHRIRRNRNTSLEIHMKTKISDGSVEKPLPASKRPAQIGIGIVFNMPEGQEEKTKHFQNFVFSHITLIEGHVNKMGLLIEKSMKSKPHFQSATIEALDSFCESIFNLYLGPRLKEPVWLSMMTSTSRKGELCNTFLKELMYLVEKYNTKNKFVSCLVTSALTQHLAWVPTVAPAGGTPSRTYLDKHSAKWLDALAKSHPYNPLWAQLSDLYGAIGFPLKLSRTVVVGKKQDVIKKFLNILSYFIRCSEVFEAVEEPDQCHLDTLEAQACSQEIMIPYAARDSKDGSVKSGNSLFLPGSAMSCSNCGSVIENPYRGGGQSRLHDSVTNSPNLENSSGGPHTRWTAQKRTVRSPPPLQEANYFEFGQKRTVKSPSPVFEENHFELNTKPALRSPPSIQEQLVFDFEKSKPYLRPLGNDEWSGDCQLSMDLPSTIHSECLSKTNNVSVVEQITTQRTIPPQGTTDLFEGHEPTVGSPVCKGDESFCRSTCQCSNSEDRTEICVGLIEETNLLPDLLQEDIQSDSGDHVPIISPDTDPKCAHIRFRCPLLFTLIESDEVSDSLPSVTSEFTEMGSNTKPAFSGMIGHANSPESLQESAPDIRIIPSEDKNSDVESPTQLLHTELFSRSEEGITGGSPSVREVQDDVTTSETSICDVKSVDGKAALKENPIKRSQSDSAATIGTDPSTKTWPSPLNIPRHHSDSTFVHTNTSLEKKLCINGKLTYTIKDNLYPDLRSLKKQEGLETPEDKAEIVFPVPVTNNTELNEVQPAGETVSQDCCVRSDKGTVTPEPVLHRVKLGVTDEKNEGSDLTASVYQGSLLLSAEEPSVDVKVQRLRHVGKQSIQDVCATHLSDLQLDGVLDPKIKHLSRDSGIEDSYERTGDALKSVYLDSGVYDDFVFRSEYSNTSKATTFTTMNKTSKRHKRLVLRSFSKDSQNSFSEYGDVNVPKPEELDSISGSKKVEKPALQRLVSEGSVSLFDEYFEEQHYGEIPLFDHHTDYDAQSEQNTISESVDHERALSDISGTSENTESNSHSPPHTQGQEQLPQEVDKSILFDRISQHPVTEPEVCGEPLTTSLGSDDFEHDRTQHNRSTLSWDEGLRRRDVYDDMCSSVTDSDVTDLEGSLCSECTVKADRTGGRHRRNNYRRQSSMPSTGTPSRTNTPGRTRSVTPTELNRRRHASTLSTSTLEQLDSSDGQTPPASTLEHMIMPSFLTGEGAEKVVPVERNFGHSLLAGFSPHYLSDFTLHGTSDQNYHTRLHQDLTLAVKNPVLDESITETACIVADTEKWNVKVLSCHYNNSDRVTTQEVAPSKIISDILDSVYNLWKLKMSPEFCLMHLEDRLQEVYFKSKMLSEYLRFHRKIDHKELAAMLGFDPSDLPLLLAVAGTHTPYFALGLLS